MAIVSNEKYERFVSVAFPSNVKIEKEYFLGVLNPCLILEARLMRDTPYVEKYTMFLEKGSGIDLYRKSSEPGRSEGVNADIFSKIKPYSVST